MGCIGSAPGLREALARTGLDRDDLQRREPHE
jgi:hypothetical protein